MPHIIVEHSGNTNLDLPALLQELHSDLAQKDTIDITQIKTRSLESENPIVGDNTNRDSFVHITLRLLTGRDEALRQSMGQSLFNIAQNHINNQDVALSVEVAEMTASTYFK